MGTPWKLKRTVQCAKCPWRKATNPHDIPNGYDPEKHANLKCTIAKPSDLSVLAEREQHVMSCHEEEAAYCIGWLMHQVGRGNNISMRLHVRNCTNISEVKLIGEQHETFEDTLPS